MAARRCRRLLHEARDGLEGLDPADPEALHRVRMVCKKIHYAALLFPDLREVFGAKVFKEARHLQGLLGHEHDLVRSAA